MRGRLTAASLCGCCGEHDEADEVLAAVRKLVLFNSYSILHQNQLKVKGYFSKKRIFVELDKNVLVITNIFLCKMRLATYGLNISTCT